MSISRSAASPPLRAICHLSSACTKTKARRVPSAAHKHFGPQQRNPKCPSGPRACNPAAQKR
eukprot:11173192-Lingulodinium_polyedra.AAC.1